MIDYFSHLQRVISPEVQAALLFADILPLERISARHVDAVARATVRHTERDLRVTCAEP